MNTTSIQDQQFLETIVFPNISLSILEEAIEWIRKNMSPEDVFGLGDLKIWAEDNNYIDVSREKE